MVQSWAAAMEFSGWAAGTGEGQGGFEAPTTLITPAWAFHSG
jgi:hypothetical protein